MLLRSLVLWRLWLDHPAHEDCASALCSFVSVSLPLASDVLRKMARRANEANAIAISPGGTRGVCKIQHEPVGELKQPRDVLKEV